MSLCHKRLGLYIVLYFYEEMKKYARHKTEWVRSEFQHYKRDWPDLRSFLTHPLGLRVVLRSFAVVDEKSAEDLISALSMMCLCIEDAHEGGDTYKNRYAIPDEVMEHAHDLIMELIEAHKKFCYADRTARCGRLILVE